MKVGIVKAHGGRPSVLTITVTLVVLTILFIPRAARAQGTTVPCGGSTCAVFHLDTATQVLMLKAKYRSGTRVKNAASLENWAGRRGMHLTFATNAGIFDPFFSPLGLHIEQGKELVGINHEDGSGNFYLKPNGVFLVAKGKASIIDAATYTPVPETSVATQSGPLLLNHGNIHPSFRENSSNKLVRSGVGVKGDSEVFFAISDGPVSFFEFATFFKEELHCESALYLDGFISKMYIADSGRIQKSGDFAALFYVLADSSPPQDPAPRTRSGTP